MANIAHKILVTVQNGKPVCVPNETSAQPGDTITWNGEPHTGTIDGKINAAKRKGYTEAELMELKASGQVDPQKQPTLVADWHETQPLTIKADAEPGTYSYTITLTSNGAKSDPIILIGGDGDL